MATSSASISSTSGPCDRAKAVSASSLVPNQWTLPSRRASQYRIKGPGLSSRNVRRMCSGRGGSTSQKPPGHPGLYDNQSPVIGKRHHNPLSPPRDCFNSYLPPATFKLTRVTPSDQQGIVDLDALDHPPPKGSP